MKRIARWTLIVAAALVAAVLVLVALPEPEEEFPLIDHIPADAIAYAGFEDYRQLENLPETLVGTIRDSIRQSESYLAGPVAVYIDREREWVFLARLTRTARIFSGGDVVDGVAVVTQTPEGIERHRERSGHLITREVFQTLKSSLFVDLEALRLPGRLRDFSAAGFEFDPGPPLVLRGRALYRNGIFRLYVEHYLHAPPIASPSSDADLAATFIEHFPRLWDQPSL